MFGKPVGDDVVLSIALLSDHRFDGASKAHLISPGAGANEVEQELRSRHDPRSMASFNRKLQAGR